MPIVAVIGSESVGKTTLCRTLHKRYGYEWVPEYAREYVEGLDRPYTYEDVCQIAERQIEDIARCYLASKRNSSGDKPILFDTDLIITKVWFLHCYGSCPEEVRQAIRDYPFDLYLLLAPDIAAEPDPVRENIDRRQFFFEWYLREIEESGRPLAIIRGSGEERIQNALREIRRYTKAL